ncbi:hypothetical protein CEP53_014372 [Fusarium sp. AF-6]|nr:hypothetical protein CEP53_014372 [Fusarium sp. AF-6]
MSQNSNGMMTLDVVDRAGKKKEFINVIEKDPYKAVEQILGPAYDPAYFQRMSIYSWETVDLGDYGVFRHRGLMSWPSFSLPVACGRRLKPIYYIFNENQRLLPTT